MKRSPTRALGLALILLSACSEEANDEHIPADGPPPVSGGTLHVTEDGRYAIASDPDRASLYVVSLETRTELHRIVLGPQDEPGRITDDSAGRVHVVLRRAGEVLTLDPATGTVLSRRPVCSAPRGIDVDPDSGELLVACAEGQLVRLSADSASPSRVVTLEHDLRDVVAQSGGKIFVSRFRSSEVLVLQDDAVVARIQPPDATGGFGSGAWESTVAWRLREHPDGVMLVHQYSVGSQLGSTSFTGLVYYGGDCDNGVVRPAVTIFDNDTFAARSIALSGASLAVDGVSDSGTIYTAAAAEPGLPRDQWGFDLNTGARAVDEGNFGPLPSCMPVSDPISRPSAAIAVAMTSERELLVQYRDPAVIVVREPSGATQEIALSAGRAVHAGHAIFHEAAGTGATCAGCHPEGAEDGHVWLFDIGVRRTQTMTGGVLATAPFHWTGDITDLTRVMEGTFVGRMSGQMPRADEVASLEQWVDRLPATPAPLEPTDAIARGHAAFDSAGCGDCHSGELRTNNATLDVNTDGRFQVPALYEVVYHAPYMHDGRASTLDDVVQTHGGGAALSTEQQNDLVSYLRSL